LDLYPDRFVVRYRSELATVQLVNVDWVGPEVDKVRITAGDHATMGFLTPRGSLTLVSGRMPESEAVAEQPTLFAPPAEATNVRPQAEQANRVMLTGRLGRDVHLRTTANGKVVGRVSLAVHRGEETDWHTILFFDDKAQKAAEELQKGQLVTVVGYKHLREVQGRDGSTKQVEEIYAASVQQGRN
jgi:hypothetical protein